MVRYYAIILIALALFAAPANATVKSGNATGWDSVSAVQQYQGAAWQNITPKDYSGAAWYALISYGSDYDFVIALGQSQVPAFAWGTVEENAPLTPDTTTGIEIKADMTYTNPLDDPCAVTSGYFDSGLNSPWPGFCNQYYTNAGKSPIMLILGDNSSGLTVDPSGSGGRWWGGSDPEYPYAKTIIDNALSKLSTDAYNIGTAISIIWFHGETDGEDGVSEAVYAAALDAMFSQIVSDYSGYTVSFYIVKTKNTTSAILAADDDVATSRNDTVIACSTSDLATVDGTHFTADARTTIGERIANAIAP